MKLVSANLNSATAWSDTARSQAAALLRETGAEIIAVQECPKGHEAALADLAEQVGGWHYRIGPAPKRLHTALMWAPHIEEIQGGDSYQEDTWHGYTVATLRGAGWPSPITVISAHLAPHSSVLAITEAQLLQSRVRRWGHPGIIAGDINHMPLHGPEPDWDSIPHHNRGSRTLLDPDHPEHVRADRRVVLALQRGGLTDVAAHLHQQTNDEELLAPTGVYGRTRVDQIHVTEQLTPAIVGYERLDHRDLTDHHPVAAELDLQRLGLIDKAEFH